MRRIQFIVYAVSKLLLMVDKQLPEVLYTLPKRHRGFACLFCLIHL